MSEKDAKTTALETVKELAGEIYTDVAKPTLKSVGSIISLPFRAIDAALTPIKKWIAKRDYNYQQTRQLLAEKLKDVDESKIVEPEPYVAVPAMQQLAYSYDSKELRKMYANLLASSMVVDTKNNVHPSFVEIIKQLSPVDAVALNLFKLMPMMPIVHITLAGKRRSGYSYLIKDYCISMKDFYPDVYAQACGVENLQRLGLIDISYDRQMNFEYMYEKYIDDDEYQQLVEKYKDDEDNEVEIIKGVIDLTDFGKAFCTVCCD